MEVLTRALFEEILSEGSKGVTLCREETQPPIDFKGRKYEPDKTKGFLKFKMSHAFPVINAYGQALHPNVIAQSFQSLLYQNLNYEHIVVAYDKKSYSSDKFLGTVVDVDFPSAPVTGWKVSADKEDVPHIEAVASFAKLARGMDTVVGRHLGGRHKYSVSMEIQYPYKDCGFAIALNEKKPTINKDTPEDLLAAGWEYVPWIGCDDDLLGCFSLKENRIVKDWKGRKVVQMMGGLDKPVHYSGVAIVQYGAEAEAEILQMAASNTQQSVLRVLFPLQQLATNLTGKQSHSFTPMAAERPR